MQTVNKLISLFSFFFVPVGIMQKMSVFQHFTHENDVLKLCHSLATKHFYRGYASGGLNQSRTSLLAI
jgi:putative effector of murein hydrolase LrgA (UPF0299 family)